MIKKECSCCMRYHCEYKDNYNLCSRNNKRIKAKQGTTTILERILQEYLLFIISLKKKYKICPTKKIDISNYRMGLTPWEHSQTYAIHPLKKKLMVNNPIQKDIKIYELYFPDEDWMYHDIMEEYVTNKCKTYLLKNVVDWRDLLEKIIRYYKNLNFNHRIIITSIEELTNNHYKDGNKRKKLKGNEFVVRLSWIE